MSIGKRLNKAREGVDREKLYALPEAIKMVKERAKAKFVETIEISMNLGVDPRHADHPEPARAPHQVIKERRLADPWLAAHHQRPATAGPRARDQPVEDLALRLAPEQRRLAGRDIVVDGQAVPIGLAHVG